MMEVLLLMGVVGVNILLCSSELAPSVTTLYKQGFHKDNIPLNVGGWTKWHNAGSPGKLGDNEMISDIIAKYGQSCVGFPCQPEDVIVTQVRLREGYLEEATNEQFLGSTAPMSCSVYDYHHLPTGHQWLYTGRKKPGKLLKVGDDDLYIGLDGARCMKPGTEDGSTCRDYEVRFFCLACPTRCCHRHEYEMFKMKYEWIDKMGLKAGLKYM